MSNIPVFKPYLNDEEILASIEALRLGWLGPGSYVKIFEEKIADLLNISPTRVVAVNTGTSAVHLALKLAGVSFGDEVITPSFNNIADFQSIRYLGADPVFCDVKEGDLTIDPSKVEDLISKNTKAIICLDYGAALCDYKSIKKLGDKYSIPVIYDAAHSFGSKHTDDSMVGSEADFCTFSFDPVKNITCIDGGAIVFKSEELAKKARYMRLLGQKQDQSKLYTNTRSWTYDVDHIGYRYHLANLHAAIGVVQLGKIAEIKNKRRKIFNYYYTHLHSLEGINLPPPLGMNVLPFIFILKILNGKRAQFMEYLTKEGIDTGIHWQPGHKFTFFNTSRKGNLKVTEKAGAEIVTLPMYPDLTDDELKKIVKCIKNFKK